MKAISMRFPRTVCPAFDGAAPSGYSLREDTPSDLSDRITPVMRDREPTGADTGLVGAVQVLIRTVATWLTEVLPMAPGAIVARAGGAGPSAPRRLHRAITPAMPASSPLPRSKKGKIVLVGAGPGARDLLTLRAVERLQAADVVFYDRLVDPDVLDLAHREAERVYVGKEVGAHAWPQHKITQAIVAEALKGRSVVRLKSGDPGIFGRASEELTAAQEAGIPVELVPGVTSASAAGAALGQSLTERGVADTFVIATGSGCADNPEPECTRLTGPGTTTAFYMSARHAGRISKQLLDKGLPAQSPVDVCVDVSKSTEHLVRTTIADLPMAMQKNRITNCAIILVTWPHCVEQCAYSLQAVGEVMAM